MGMDVSIRGIIPATDEYNKKAAAYWACDEAGIDIPDDLRDYFNGCEPCEDGMAVRIDYGTDYDDCLECYTVDIEDLPSNIKQIQFILSC